MASGKKRRITKNERRRQKLKLAKLQGKKQSVVETPKPNPKQPEQDVEVIYVSQPLEPQKNPEVAAFSDVFAKFGTVEELMTVPESSEPKIETVDDMLDEAAARVERQAEEEEARAKEKNKLSRKDQKAEKRFLVAKLKQTVDRPDVVEVHDVTSADPHLLIYLKAYPNTVPVPVHWCAKRKYLMGKRGFDKPPWKLPDFIAQTGIAKIRSAVEEKEGSVKQRARERMAPKMGRIDIDYAVLHDAFFKYQTKPKLTSHGEVYFEGMENDVTLKHKKPGQLSQTLKDALGIPDNAPPPWLINMQRYGPPPSYPSLKIPGLNYPIPKGASFGFHPGGWGKPPVDQFGKALYGNVFDKEEEAPAEDLQNPGLTDIKSHWGEVVAREDASDSEDEEEEDDGEMEMETVEQPSEQVVVAAQPSLPPAAPVPSFADSNERALDLRKGFDTDVDPARSRELYKVVEQKDASVGKELHGSSFKYVLEEKEDPDGMSSILSKKGAAQPTVPKTRPKAYDDFKF